MTPVSIRFATPADDRALAELDSRAWPLELQVSPPSPAAQPFFFAHRRPEDVLVATSGERLLGYGRLGRHLGAESNAHVLHIHALAVDPPARGQGVAGALIDALITEATVRGAVKLGLRALSVNRRAIRLYERAGFTLEGRLIGEIRLPDGSFADDLWYARSLGPTSSPSTDGVGDVLSRLRRGRWVDLTHAFAPGIPHYVEFPDEQRTTLFHYDEGVGTRGAGFLAHEYRHIGQWGTHMDPPAHFIRGGRTQDEVDVSEMILELVVIDVRERAAEDPDYACGRDDITAWEARHGQVPAGAFVALLTGWAERWPDPEAMQNRDADGVAHYPGWGVDALELLVSERRITAIGHDMTDTDPGARVSAGHAPAETYILAADRWQIELLANLDRVPPRGALIVATWPKPQGGSGFPARAFAILP